MLTEEIKQRREKGRGREWQFEEEAARLGKLRESGKVNKETLRSVLMISAESTEKKRLLKESYIKLHKTSVMKGSSPCLCV